VSQSVVRVERHPADSTINVVKVDGEIDLALRQPLAEALERAGAENGAGVLVDMSRCLFVDSTGIALLINSLRRLIRTRGALAILCPNPTPRRVFDLTKTADTLSVVDTDSEAVAAIDQGRAALRRGRTA
jgi:anti-anti-sigma factor